MPNLNTCIFNYAYKRSRERSENVSSNWFQFSRVVPRFLRMVDANIDNVNVKTRIQSIIYEEEGSGSNEANHAFLFKQALRELSLNVVDKQVVSVEKLFYSLDDLLSRSDDREAISVGATYGLEIVAEENIKCLLYYSSSSSAELDSLKRTTFFKIHLQNEVDHIEKCKLNKLIVCNGANRQKSFELGEKLASSFWHEFWQESLA